MTLFAVIEGRKLRRKVRAVVTDQTGHVLLIRPYGYAEGCWTLPGGGVEAGESPIEAASRELQEELGLSSEQAKQTVSLNITSEFIYGADHKAKRGLDHDGQFSELFHCQLLDVTSVRRQVEEIEEVAWFSHDEALEAFKVAAQKAIFQRCLSKLYSAEGPGLRT